MPTTNKDYENRIKSLEQEINQLKHALGQFAVGLDKVSQVQANQTSVIAGLIQATETQAHVLKKLVDNTNRNNELAEQNEKLLRKLLGKGGF
ncbi:MAG: hypothetical protein HY867_07055 [Chloroflexi bacterium]|nr:hypothetical protein [Chloroflexota bacterium]